MESTDHSSVERAMMKQATVAATGGPSAPPRSTLIGTESPNLSAR
jgi:hypothetical protein